MGVAEGKKTAVLVRSLLPAHHGSHRVLLAVVSVLAVALTLLGPAEPAQAAARESRITASWSATVVPYGQPLTLAGRMTPATNARGKRRIVRPQVLLDGRWHNVTQARVNRRGRYRMTFHPGWVGVTRYRAFAPSSRGVRAVASRPMLVQVSKIPSGVSMDVSNPAIVMNGAATSVVTGQVSGGAGGARTVVLVRVPRAGSLEIARTTTDVNGAFSFALPKGFLQNHRVAAVALETDRSAAAASHHAAYRVDPDYAPIGNAANWSLIDPAVRWRWNPCAGPVTFRVNPNSARGGDAVVIGEVREAFKILGQATGLTFDYLGTTTAIPGNRSIAWPRDAEVVVAWATDAQTDWPMHDAYARGGPLLGYDRVDADGPVIESIQGGVVMDKADDVDANYLTGFNSGPDRRITRGLILIHELGHVMGLGHVDFDKQQIMGTPTEFGPVRYSAGDLTGLRTMGLDTGCMSAAVAGRPLLAGRALTDGGLSDPGTSPRGSLRVGGPVLDDEDFGHTEH